METLKSYLTKEGWEKDWYKTKEELGNLYKRTELSDKLGNEKGSIPLIGLGTMIAIGGIVALVSGIDGGSGKATYGGVIALLFGAGAAYVGILDEQTSKSK